MKFGFWQAMSLASYLLAWFERASRDGKITADEVTEAVLGAVRALELDVEIAVPSSGASPPSPGAQAP